MKPRQRQAAILEYLQKQGKCSVEELAQYFDTTGTTIRKDLVILEHAGTVIRTYGGVVLNKEESDPPIDHKTLINTHKKELIAEAAVSFIHDGDSIILDAGSTVLQMVPLLSRFNNITVMTNSLHIVNALSELDNEQTILMPGGTFRKKSASFHGQLAENAFEHFTFDKLFMGTDGIEYMLQATEGLPVDVRFMLPSCVPATPMDESGAVLDYRTIDSFYDHPRVQGLAEMMNYPGVIGGDSQVIEKIVAAQAHHKKIDGHAPGLLDNDLNAYIAAGVYSDHECYDSADAIAKLERGQFIMIREGTAAHNLEALLPLLTPKYADRCMFCSDDKHPSDLLEKGHIDFNIRQAIRQGVDPILAVKVACHHAARYFLLNNRGAIAPGYLADFVVIDNFQDFRILQVFKRGVEFYDGRTVRDFPAPEVDPYLVRRAHDTFHLSPLAAQDFAERRPRGIIGMVPGEIVTEDQGYSDHIDTDWDILKIAVIERHKNTRHIGIGYLQGYGLKSGAVATSVSHDSHNIIVVGANEEDMAAAVNQVVENRGGIVVMDGGQVKGQVILGIAGIMSEDTLEHVNRDLEHAKEAAFALGVSRGIDPFMTLSFMALPVIPTLRLTTRGVIDVLKQQYI